MPTVPLSHRCHPPAISFRYDHSSQLYFHRTRASPFLYISVELYFCQEINQQRVLFLATTLWVWFLGVWRYPFLSLHYFVVFVPFNSVNLLRLLFCMLIFYIYTSFITLIHFGFNFLVLWIYGFSFSADLYNMNLLIVYLLCLLIIIFVHTYMCVCPYNYLLWFVPVQSEVLVLLPPFRSKLLTHWSAVSLALYTLRGHVASLSADLYFHPQMTPWVCTDGALGESAVYTPSWSFPR